MRVARNLPLMRNGSRRTARPRSQGAIPWLPPGQTAMDYTVAMMPSATRTRVLVSQGPDELLRAVLPPPSSVHHEQAAIRLLEGLALWLSAKLHVVLCVDDKDAAFCLGLTDEVGIGARSIYFLS